MKNIRMLALVALSANPALAQYQQPRPYGTGSNPNSHYVQPHTNSNGSYTGGHYRTNPDNSRTNNFGSPGNFNPYTGNTAPPPKKLF